jgi:hypothetical protein
MFSAVFAHFDNAANDLGLLDVSELYGHRRREPDCRLCE